jgi:hypothetical protein
MNVRPTTHRAAVAPVATLALALTSCGANTTSENPAVPPSEDGAAPIDAGQGTPWQEVSFPAQAGSGYNAIAYGNGRWVAVGDGVTATSKDGTTWSVQSLAPSTPNYENDGMGFGNGLFVSAGFSSVSTSSDGVTWSTQKLANAQGLGASAFGGGTWVVLDNRFLTDDAFAVWTSQDAANWTPVVTTVPYGELGAIAYGNGQFVAVGWGSLVATSPDGAHWTMQPFPVQDGLSAVAFGNGFFLAGGTSGPAYRSTDGKTWTPEMPTALLRDRAEKRSNLRHRTPDIVPFLPARDELRPWRDARDLLGDLRRVVRIVAAEDQQRHGTTPDVVARYAEDELTAEQVRLQPGKRVRRDVRAGRRELRRPIVVEAQKQVSIPLTEADRLKQDRPSQTGRGFLGESQAKRTSNAAPEDVTAPDAQIIEQRKMVGRIGMPAVGGVDGGARPARVALVDRDHPKVGQLTKRVERNARP